MMTGLRGVGKTVLLNEFCSIAHGNNWAFQQIEADDDFDMPRILAERVRLALLSISPGQRLAERVRRGLRVLKSFALRWQLPEGASVELNVDPLPGKADTGILHHDLADLFEELGECAKDRKVGVLFTIDEAQLLPLDQLGHLIMGLHRVSQRQLPFMVVCAGLPSLRALAGEAKSYAERLFDFVTINSLQSHEAARALTAPAQKLLVEWHSDALQKVVEETSGYPYFLQEFGKGAWNAAVGPDQITLQDIGTAVPMAVETLDRGFFRIRYDRTTDAERQYLSAMASLGPGPHPSGKVASAMGKTTTQAGMQRNSVIAKGLCYAPRHGEIAFTVPMFDRFVRRQSGV